MLFCRKHFHDRIIWLRKSRLTPPLFIEVPVPDQEDERSCICLLGVSLSTIFLLNVSTMWYFLFFILIHLITILAAMCRISYLYINMSCKGQVVYAKSVIQINTNISLVHENIINVWKQSGLCVRESERASEREREREREREQWLSTKQISTSHLKSLNINQSKK